MRSRCTSSIRRGDVADCYAEPDECDPSGVRSGAAALAELRAAGELRAATRTELLRLTGTRDDGLAATGAELRARCETCLAVRAARQHLRLDVDITDEVG